MNQKIKVKVTGGNLVAMSNLDPDNPGICVKFVPDRDDIDTELLMVEEDERSGIFKLYSYMAVPNSKPEVSTVIYDHVILWQMAYEFYYEYCVEKGIEPKRIDEFHETIFMDEDALKEFLPERLLNNWRKIREEF